MNYQQICERLRGIAGELAVCRSNAQLRKESPERYYVHILMLRAVQIVHHMKLGRTGYTADRRAVERAFREAADAVRELTEQTQLTRSVICQTAELITMMDAGNLWELVKLLPAPLRSNIVADYAAEPEQYAVFVSAVNWCLEHGEEETASRIVERFTERSRIRNADEPELHRLLVVSVLDAIVDTDRECVVRIGDRQQILFADGVNEQCCIFFWLYAVSLDAIGRTRDAHGAFCRCRNLCVALGMHNSCICCRAELFLNLGEMVEEESDTAELRLWEQIGRMKAGYYTDLDEQKESVSVQTAVVIFHLMQRKFGRDDYGNDLPYLEWLLEFSTEHEAECLDPRLCRRNMETLLAKYYERHGMFLQAGKHCWNALEAVVPEGVQPIIADEMIYSNLMNIYTRLNDFEQMERLGEIIQERLDRYEEENSGPIPGGHFRLQLVQFEALQRLGYLFEDEVEGFREQLLTLYEAMEELTDPAWEEDREERVSFMLYISGMIQCVMNENCATARELHCYRDLLQLFLDHPLIYPMDQRQRLLLVVVLARIEWNLGGDQARAMLDLAVEQLGKIPPEDEMYISGMRMAAAAYFRDGYLQSALMAAKKMLYGVTTAWHKAVGYLDDQKVCKLLLYTNLHVMSNYRILHGLAGAWELYEYVLQSKDLPSLVCRERNRLMRNNAVDEELRSRIFSLQDQIAAARQSDLLMGTDTVPALTRRLLDLEAEFAESFPENLQFTRISFAEMARRVPDYSAVIEYAFAPGLQNMGDNEQTSLLDIFVTVKRNGKTSLHYIRHVGADGILEDANTYIQMLQDPDSYLAEGVEQTRLCAQLYRTLIEPALEYVGGVSNLYIAPDQELCNLPFEILCTGDSGMLQDRFRICRLVCGRDLLFAASEAGTAAGKFILGDPNYEAVIGQRRISRERSAGSLLEPVSALPFSGLEADRVSRRCRTVSTTGNAATKYAFLDALPSGIIHLATHGVFDTDREMDPIYGAYLIFAGYNRWVTQKTESEGCGNGILTADEISRADLRRTALVVLSACNSGMGSVNYGTIQGLVSAFSATGVRWVVSHLWKANDFATAIVMDMFYEAYQSYAMEVPDALRYAKQYLRRVTVGQLRDRGWFNPRQTWMLSQEARAELEWWSKTNDRRKPFAEERYWGGFVCHRCN